MDDHQNLITTCYHTKPGPHGWCGTVVDIGDVGDEGQGFDVRSDKGWGFCQRECGEEHKFRQRVRNSAFYGIGKRQMKRVKVKL